MDISRKKRAKITFFVRDPLFIIQVIKEFWSNGMNVHLSDTEVYIICLINHNPVSTDHIQLPNNVKGVSRSSEVKQAVLIKITKVICGTSCEIYAATGLLFFLKQRLSPLGPYGSTSGSINVS